MKKYLKFLLPLVLIVGLVAQAAATDYILYYDRTLSGSPEFYIDEDGNTLVKGNLTVTGTLTATTTGGVIGSTTFGAGTMTFAGTTTDGYQWVGPMDVFATGYAGATNTFSLTRVALGNMALRYTGVNSPAVLYVVLDLSRVMHRPTASKGVKITAIDFCYGITTGSLSGHSATILKCTYASGVANAVTTTNWGTLTYKDLSTENGSTAGLTTAASATPYGTQIYPATAIWSNEEKACYLLEIAATMAQTTGTVYDIYGFGIRYTQAPL